MTILDIWNRALAAIGHERVIPDLDSAMTESNRCRLQWDNARKAVLTAHDWNWLAQETPLISGCSHHHESGEYAYPYPTDCLRIIKIAGADGKSRHHRVANGQILAVEPSIRIRFIPDNLDLDMWPSSMIDALVCELAARIALPMTANAESMSAMAQQAQYYLAQARYYDTSEHNTDGEERDRYIKARR